MIKDTFDIKTVSSGMLTFQAFLFAAAAHEAIGQRRKYTNTPYIEHPVRVASIVRRFGGTQSMIAAALLHDVVEDTAITIRLIQSAFGSYVAQLVAEVTDVSKPEDGNRATRKALDRRHLSFASNEGKTIKVADLIDNTADITAHDPDFARVYLAEKRLLLPVLKGAEPEMYDAAWLQLEEAERKLA